MRRIWAVSRHTQAGGSGGALTNPRHVRVQTQRLPPEPYLGVAALREGVSLVQGQQGGLGEGLLFVRVAEEELQEEVHLLGGPPLQLIFGPPGHLAGHRGISAPHLRERM